MFSSRFRRRTDRFASTSDPCGRRKIIHRGAHGRGEDGGDNRSQRVVRNSRAPPPPREDRRPAGAVPRPRTLAAVVPSRSGRRHGGHRLPGYVFRNHVYGSRRKSITTVGTRPQHRNDGIRATAYHVTYHTVVLLCAFAGSRKLMTFVPGTAGRTDGTV